MDCNENIVLTIQQKTKEWFVTAKAFVHTKGFKKKRDRAVLILFVLQFLMVAGLSIHFGRKTSGGFSDVPLSPHVTASRNALLSCTAFCVLVMLAPNHISHIAFTIPWAAPLIVGVTIAGFQYDGRTLDLQFPILVLAATTFLATGAGFHLFRNHVRFTTTILKAALKSLSIHPRLVKQSILLTLLCTVWILAWSVAVVGVFQWKLEQNLFVTRTAIIREKECDFSFQINGSLKGLQFKSLSRHDFSFYSVIPFCFFLSLYWTQQSCRNTIQVAVATAVAAWWRVEKAKEGISLLTAFSTFHPSIAKFLLKSMQIHRTRFALRLKGYLHLLSPSRQLAKDSKSYEQLIFLKSSRLSFIYLGFYGHAMALPNVTSADAKYQRAVFNLIWKDRRLDLFLFLCTFAIAMTSGSLTWLLDASNSVPSFFMGLGYGWITGDTLLGMIKAAVDSNFLCVAGFIPDGNLPRTNMYFALRKELLEVCPETFEENDH